MTWTWDGNDHVAAPDCAIRCHVMRPAMTRDQDHKPAFAVLYEDDFAVALHFSTREGGDASVRHALMLAVGGDWRVRSYPSVRSFDTLDRQRRYLAVLQNLTAQIPPEVLTVPGATPAPFVLHPPVFRDGYWTPYSQFLLPDPAG